MTLFKYKQLKLLAILNTLDALATCLTIFKYSTEVELNPIVLFLIGKTQLSWVTLLILKLVFINALIYVLDKCLSNTITKKEHQVFEHIIFISIYTVIFLYIFVIIVHLVNLYHHCIL